ncbi:MAG: type II toxin-antitoxin system RelB/DinJ family antitoxin [Patescibacteria group bacterium]
MEKTILNVKINKDLKESARKVAEELGLPLSVIVNSYLKRLVDERRIEFVAHPTPNKETQKLLMEISKDIKEGKNLSGPFDTVEEMDKYLNSL